MKKVTIICAALALLATVSSCKKDQETVNLGVAIEQSAKLYIDDHMPSWNAGDQVYVNDDAYSISNPVGGNGQLNNVTAASGYRAIYPASLIASGSNITSTTSVPVTLTNSTVTTVTANVNSLTPYPGANLVDGPTFNAAIPTTATAVRFEYNNTSVTSGTLLSTATSPISIYGNLASDGTWVVSTAASTIYAHANCSNMFRGTWSSSTGTFVPNLTSIDFGSGFRTDSVTNMSNMFIDCRSLTSLDLSNFNTSSVTDMSFMFLLCSGLTSLNLSNFNTSSVTNMSFMFYGCRSLTSLNVSNFNTSSVTNMNGMFGSCSGLTSLNLYNFNMGAVTSKESMCYHLATPSHACTITCPTAVRTAMESGTNLPTSGVTFTWNTH